ncbi:hypothetical protein DFP73DRAFT_559891 [Morchella snyderi]|nr:hypothetical protein DFP73DRAFT_559891 [Morchella snyderi]
MTDLSSSSSSSSLPLPLLLLPSLLPPTTVLDDDSKSPEDALSQRLFTISDSAPCLCPLCLTLVVEARLRVWSERRKEGGKPLDSLSGDGF